MVGMSAKEFAELVEKKELIDYQSDNYEVRKKKRSPFDWLTTGGGLEVWEWVKLKIECGATDLTIEEYNEWIIQDFIENAKFWKDLPRKEAIERAKRGGYLL